MKTYLCQYQMYRSFIPRFNRYYSIEFNSFQKPRMRLSYIIWICHLSLLQIPVNISILYFRATTLSRFQTIDTASFLFIYSPPLLQFGNVGAVILGAAKVNTYYITTKWVRINRFVSHCPWVVDTQSCIES